MCHYVQKRVETHVMYFIFRTALDAEDHEAKVARIDTGVVQAISNRFRGPCAANAVPLESGKTFFLDCDNNLVAFQQTGGAVMRSADTKNPRLFTDR
jgi:hypothetical protein